MPSFSIVGLPDKAVGESRERIRAALTSIGLALPPKKIIVNLAPADLQKEGSHFDLPIALGILVALGALSPEDVIPYLSLGELALDGRLSDVSGILPSALLASSLQKGLICPKKNGNEAAWANGIEILAAPDLIALMNHFKGKQVLGPPTAILKANPSSLLEMTEIKGQESAKRALEIAAAGGHNLLLQGPPGSGKSMLAARLPGLLPPLEPQEALEVTMIHSLAGQLNQGHLIRERPFRDPHHSSSLASLVGGGVKARPGEVSLAHHGVLFLDELPEFARSTLETLRQPLEAGQIMVARANAHITYPARFQLIAAMNPCPCGYLDDPSRACTRAPRCAVDYQSRLSGPLLDRLDLNVFVPLLKPSDLSLRQSGETTKTIAVRVHKARALQTHRYRLLAVSNLPQTNASISSKILEEFTLRDAQGEALLSQAVEKFNLSARGYHRILRVARTIADLENSEKVRLPHIAEAIHYRQVSFSKGNF